MTTTGLQAVPAMSTTGLYAVPTMTTTGLQAVPTMTTTELQAVPTMTTTESQYDDIGDEEDSLSVIDDVQSTYDFGTQVEANDFKFQKNARDKIIDQYTINPTINKRKVNPILIFGTPDKNVYIGTDGKLFNVNNGKFANKPLNKYDWVATYDYILNFFSIETKDNAIGSMSQFRFNIESGAHEVLYDILMNNAFPEGTRDPIPYKKGRNQHGGYIPVNGGYRVKGLSWESTLDMYIKYMKQNNISFNQSPILYNANPWLADEKVFLEGPKIGKKTYYLGEYAAITSKKQREISPSIKNRVDKNANWLGALNEIIEKYGDRIESDDINVKLVNPKRFQRALSFSSIGLGFGSQAGRRGILKHEFYKLQGEIGLGNANRRLERELKLIRRAF
ncbi:uncharacterized protein PITG_19134 [Phytophthora infestans T30-4]|uniref:Uncharacterized protein n=1 Tax=Phytophthora infestans (strain T30-4) TaxID=403677 RepID=D0NYX2_PHYIT|nr:uncharacterized protein PITG_19134 [Phytophthora infestans T30-4]EEY68755.1 hypothetical protein PITG_19134 [Phytophthora infestans T30-4]|eukprot:XP_002997447.1 hypothetical protein PITG_19134 [Phytophthora infestans T30-4]